MKTARFQSASRSKLAKAANLDNDVDLLAADIQREFPGIAGFSPANVWRMRAFYLAWTDEVLAHGARESGKTNLARAARDLDGRNLPQAVAEIPWFHNVAIMEKLKSMDETIYPIGD